MNDLSNARRYCLDKTRQSRSSFSYSFFFLPRAKQDAMLALYAFCRAVDDVVDESSEPHLAQIQLAWWHEEIERLYRHQPQHPITQLLQPAIEQFGLPASLFVEILEGMHMDLVHTRYACFDELARYCYHVASTVGLLSARIFGCRDEATLLYAEALGMAFQLTNIIRDVGEDALRQRIYLPGDEMETLGVSQADILARHHSPAFEALMQQQFERAQAYYDRAFSLLPPVDRAAQLPGLMMANVYRTLLEEIRAERFQVLNQRIRLPSVRKAWICLMTWCRG